MGEPPIKEVHEESKSSPPSNNGKSYHTDPSAVINYDLTAAPRNQKILILTEGKVTQLGLITGNKSRDRGIIGWFGMPVRDKDLEERLGL